MATKKTNAKTAKVPAKPVTKATTKVATKVATKTPGVTKADGKLSQLNAAVKVLAESGIPMTTKAMIEAMATQGYWTSPGGVTPHATLYSAIHRELHKKGPVARFVKADRGQFTLNPAARAN